MNPLRHLVWLLSLASIASLSTGCVTIGLGEAMVIDEQPLDNKRVQVLSRAVRVDVDQEDTELTITAERTCNVEDRARVRQTVVRERVNTSPGTTWQLGIYGTILAGVGTGLVIDAQLNVEDKDTAARDYNPVGPALATGIGAAFLAAATPLLTIAIIDGFRATGTEEDTTEVQKTVGVVEKGKTCQKRVPAARAAVVGKTDNGTKLVLGNTDMDGTLAVDLAKRVPSSITLREKATKLALFLEGQPIGHADLRPVAASHRKARMAHEEAEWEVLNVDMCEKGSKPDCDAVRAYLKKYPDGAHATQAREALKKGELASKQREAATAAEKKRQAEAAAKAAAERRRKEQAAKVCRSKCASGCKGNQQCVQACVAAKCQ